jgi:hypothetical protein
MPGWSAGQFCLRSETQSSAAAVTLPSGTRCNRAVETQAVVQ